MGCRCLCHHWCWGNNRALQQMGKLMTAFDWAQRERVWDYHMQDGVDTADVIEAVLACRACLDAHTPALSGPPPALRPQTRRERAEYIDDQADGAT